MRERPLARHLRPRERLKRPSRPPSPLATREEVIRVADTFDTRKRGSRRCAAVAGVAPVSIVLIGARGS